MTTNLTFNQLFDGLSSLALTFAPFEGSAIALLDKDRSAFRGVGGAGIFAGGKVRAELSFSAQSTNAESPPKALEVASSRLQENSRAGPGEVLNSLVGTAFRLQDPRAAERNGQIQIVKNIYIEGHELRDLFAFPLHGQRPPVLGRLIGLLVLNNARNETALAQWLSNKTNATALRLLLSKIASVGTEYVDNPTALLEALQTSPIAGALIFGEASLSKKHGQLALVYGAVGAASAIFGFLGGLGLMAALDGHGIFGQTSSFLTAVSIACLGFALELIGGLLWLKHFAAPRIDMEE